MRYYGDKNSINHRNINNKDYESNIFLSSTYKTSLNNLIKIYGNDNKYKKTAIN